VPSPTELLAATYRSLSEQVADLRPEEAWQPTGCAGWAVLDLSLHLVDDARRGLVALATPADGPATSDAVAYWRAWQPTAAQDEDVAWRTRVRASVAGGQAELSGVYAELVGAVGVTAGRARPDDLVGTQGYVLRTDDVLLGPDSTATRRLTSTPPSYLMVRVPDGSSIVGGVVLSQPDGDVAGLSTIPLTSPDVASRAPRTEFDPSVGQ